MHQIQNWEYGEKEGDKGISPSLFWSRGESSEWPGDEDWRAPASTRVRQHGLSKPKRKTKGKEVQGLHKFVTKPDFMLTGTESW